MSTDKPQPRQPRGIPTGGEFAAYSHASDDIYLTSPVTVEADSRRTALLEGGYVPPTFLRALDDPRRTAGIETYWDQHFIAGEHGGATFPAMPDDYGSTTSGQALSGKRRVNRQLYEGSGVAIRMPSVTKAKQYANEVQGTFLLPLSITDDETGNTHSGWAAVTKTGPGAWSVSCPFLDPAGSAKVSEAVTTVFESRRPRAALRTVGNLLERNRERLSSNGAELNQITSTWVSAMGYDNSSSTMVMKTSRGDMYGYSVTPETYKKVKEHRSPGAAYNALVKGAADRVEVSDCGSCGRVYIESKGHSCPSTTFSKPHRAHRRGNEANTARARFLAGWRKDQR